MASLVAPADVVTAASGNVRAFTDGAGATAFVTSCIVAAQALLRQYLGYDPVAHVETQYAEPTHTEAAVGLIQWPVGPAHLALTDGYTIDTRGRLVASVLPSDRVVRYVGGWRPAAMSNADLLSLLGTPDGADGDPLTAEDLAGISEAPAEIKAALAEAAVAIGMRRAAGLVGVRETTTDIGSGSRTTRTAWQYGDVNTSIGRTPEAVAILSSACAPWRHILTA